jgi:hypothetical protein
VSFRCSRTRPAGSPSVICGALYVSGTFYNGSSNFWYNTPGTYFTNESMVVEILPPELTLGQKHII